MANDFEKQYIIREAESKDYEDLLECLRSLTEVGNVTKEQFEERLKERKHLGILTIVVEEISSKQVVGTGSLVFEPKFIRGCATKGSIEEIAIRKDMQRRGIGKMIMEHLIKEANKCYKISLTSSVENIPFYEKLKFVDEGRTMSLRKYPQQ